MPIDYSRWDNIEISDDEDIECHPNVDKKSLIRWRQQTIHNERRERKEKIQKYTQQLEWLEDYIKLLKEYGYPDSPHVGKPYPETLINHMRFFDGIPDAIQITKIPLNAPVEAHFQLWTALQSHKDTMNLELNKAITEDSKKLTSENICKTGFEGKTIISKNESKNVAINHEPVNLIVTNMQSRFDSRSEQEKIISTPQGLYFATMSGSNPDALYEFLRENKSLVSKSTSDELLAAAFQFEMAKNHLVAEQMVKRAIILNFCCDLGANGTELFFTRMKNCNSPAAEMYRAECERTISYIRSRCLVLEDKASGKLVSKINLTPEESKMQVLRELPPEIQQALIKEDEQKLNTLLAALPVNQSEKIKSKLIESKLLHDNSQLSDYSPELAQALDEGRMDDFCQILQEMDSEKASEIISKCREWGLIELEEIKDQT